MIILSVSLEEHCPWLDCKSVLLTPLTNPSQVLRVTRLNVYGKGNYIFRILNNSYKPFILNTKGPSLLQLNNPHPTD